MSSLRGAWVQLAFYLPRSQRYAIHVLPPGTIGRRDFVKLLAAGAGAWALTGCRPGSLAEAALPATASPTPHLPVAVAPAATSAPVQALRGQPALPKDFRAGRLTANEDFYVITYADLPSVDPSSWRLVLGGLFSRPMQLGLTDLVNRRTRQTMHTLECIGNPVGGNLIGNAEWVGAPLAPLLEEAGLMPGAEYLIFDCEDGYRTSVPVALGMDERSLLAFMMNGELLPRAHGSPVRVLLPGVYGQKQPKWLTSIRAVDTDVPGVWEQKGWSNAAGIQINSRIETPEDLQQIPAGQPFYVTGVALADLTGVQQVEVTADGGETWHPADRFPGPNESVWALWAWKWENPPPGQHTLMARATSGAGQTQTRPGGMLSGVFPGGTSDMHQVTVQSIAGAGG